MMTMLLIKVKVMQREEADYEGGLTLEGGGLASPTLTPNTGKSFSHIQKTSEYAQQNLQKTKKIHF